jgi:DNA-binding MarR family transcriptional regulator
MDETIGTLLGQVSRLFRRSFDERARQIGVTRPQWQVLVIVSRKPGINQGGVADLLEVEPITVGRMIDRMQESELVERRADPADRRAWRLHLTDKGESLVAQLRPLGAETLEGALEGIDPAEREMVQRALQRMLANLSRKTGDGAAG